MREAKELDHLKGLGEVVKNDGPVLYQFEEIDVDLSRRCLVVGGKNGVGKSRFLESIDQGSDENTVLVDLGELVHLLRRILQSRNDWEEMGEENASYPPDELASEGIRRLMGREYEDIEWFDLEIDPDQVNVASRFKWGSDAVLIPLFKVTYRGIVYYSPNMGLGELSIHLLYWVLWRYRDAKDLLLLLDEPDSYIAPMGSAAFLSRMVAYSKQRNWRLVVSSHTQEVVSAAHHQGVYVHLRLDENGRVARDHAPILDPRGSITTAAEVLVPAIPRLTIFVEDEVARHILLALLSSSYLFGMYEVNVLWVQGEGDLRKLCVHLPAPRAGGDVFAVIFDGDQRSGFRKRGCRTPVEFLPTDKDPDTCLLEVVKPVIDVAERFGTNIETLRSYLEIVEGQDKHDKINYLAERLGRQQFLEGAAELWVAQNQELKEEFLKSLSEEVGSMLKNS